MNMSSRAMLSEPINRQLPFPASDDSIPAAQEQRRFQSMEIPTYFTDFLQEIRPTASQKEDAKTGHETLRARLLADEKLSRIIISTFLQGSYRRATAIRPNGESRFDVDVIVVTRLDEKYFEPQHAMNLFEPFLEK